MMQTEIFENKLKSSPGRVFVKTFGCQMNVYDSARMIDLLRPHGYIVTDTVQDADLVILNTCHIREKDQRVPGGKPVADRVPLNRGATHSPVDKDAALQLGEPAEKRPIRDLGLGDE